MSQTATWSGHSFAVLSITGNWNDVPGIYIFTTTAGGYWKPLYIGQTDSFSTRLPNHERWAEAARAGATHVHAMVVPNEIERDAIERSLIGTFQPLLNVHHR